MVMTFDGRGEVASAREIGKISCGFAKIERRGTGDTAPFVPGARTLMPIFRTDRYGGYYKLFTENKFKRDSDPHREFCLFFDEKGTNGVADIEQCLRNTRPATEAEYQIQRDRHSL